MIQNIKIDLDFGKFKMCQYPDATSCTQHQVHELKDIHDQFGGFPESYCFDNTKIFQKWWSEEELDFLEIGEKLGIEVVTISTIKQLPGNVIPWHKDTFYQIKKRFPERKELTVRANIYLDDWKIGHFLQYQNTVSTHWKKGEGYLWDDEILHLGANAGMEPKYTLQVSGFKKN